MSSNRSKSSENKTISQFDRGCEQLTNHFSAINKNEIIYIQLLFFVLLEVLSLKLTDNDPIKSSNLFKILFHCLQKTKMLPASMTSTAKSIRQSQIFHEHVRTFQEIIQAALNLIQNNPTTASSPTDAVAITNIIDKEYPKVLLKTPLSPISNLSIDIPQPDLQLKIPLPLTFNGTLMKNDFDSAVLYRYVTDFSELGKLGRGAFGSVFSARNRLDNRLYAIKKIVFSENTDRTRRQAKSALREVRILASLCHPNIVQYHCAWLEYVPIQVCHNRISTSSSSTLKSQTLIPRIQQQDSVDEMIQFEGQSQSSHKSNLDKSPKSSTSQEDDSEISNGDFFSGESHSDGDLLSLSKSKVQHQDLSAPNNQLIPFHQANQSTYSTSKIVLFIQMQLCDTTLYDWLRYRDRTIIEQTSDEKRVLFYTLNERGQRECWNIFKQLLTAVEYLHSQSFVHRDIKPRNIFLTKDLKDSSAIIVKLGDFGLATLRDSETQHHTFEAFEYEESSGVGTALYAPPEQLNSTHCTITDKSDSYSLGIVLFELFNIFPTEMERYMSISDLRTQMKVQDQFEEYYPFESKIIEQLVLIDIDKRLTVEELLRKQKYISKQTIIEQLKKNLQDKDKRIEQLEIELEKNKS